MGKEDAKRLTGDIIEESLTDRFVLSEVTNLETRVEPVTEYHRTPWLEQWTIHRVAVSEERAAELAERSARLLTRSMRMLGTRTSRTRTSITLSSPTRFLGYPAIARDGTRRWLSTV